jgi:TRAP-type C4-dicarboxylate transport system substrate-binding protein
MVGLAAGIAVRIGVLAVALLLPSMVAAEPITLKLSFFASEHTDTFEAGVKPFVDGVNAEGKGLLAVKVYPNGALGAALAEQPNMVLEGAADIAWVVPGQTPYRFPDNQLLELPGLFRDLREGTLAFTRLIETKALRGYQDFFVIGAYTAGTTYIHSRKPVASLVDIKGQRIRVNNQMEAEVLERLGAIPTVMPAPRMAEAISRGAIHGGALAMTAVFDFRVAPLVKNHYLLSGGVAPLALVMSRKKFESLPEAAQAIIRKYSGEPAAKTWIASLGAAEQRLLERIKADPARQLVEPSVGDRRAAQHVYISLMDAWAARNPRNKALLEQVQAMTATIRSQN